MAALLYATDPATRDRLGRRARKGELHRVRRGIYVDSHDPAQIERALNAGWADVAAYLFDRPVAVFRTAAELRPEQGQVHLAVPAAARRTVPVGHLRFVVEDGVCDQGVESLTPAMRRSNPARQLLENLAPARARRGIRKTLGQEWVETQLVQEMERRGEQGLNRLRDEARQLAPILGLDNQFEKLNKIVSAVLRTHSAGGMLQTRAGIALAAGEPVDPVRLNRFQAFANYLRRLDLTALPYRYEKSSWTALTFFEGYFSSYIEGTRFTIGEAEAIAQSGKALGARHADSHDILAHIEIAGDLTEMHRLPESAADLLVILKSRHGILLAQRPDKRPGEFKEQPNQAGATLFVEPDKIRGTLTHGYDIYRALDPGLARALFVHFLVAECHPFDDGNGRIARIMMNAELVAADLYKVIVPSVCRDNYLAGLRLATRQDRFRTIVKVLHQLHRYTASINWADYNDARSTLETHAADREPDDGLMIFNKVLREFTSDYPAG